MAKAEAGAKKWNGTAILTYTGEEFHPLNPTVEEVHPLDIAHPLALKTRYTGHCKFFYSVAQHSVYVYDYARALGMSAVDCKWALLHDASEAYLPDVATPIKGHLPGFREIEERLLRVIGERFGLPWPKNPQLSIMDRTLYWHEMAALMHPVEWVTRDNDAEEVPDVVKVVAPIGRWTPEVAERAWWLAFEDVFPDEPWEAADDTLW